jgi:hypothetical protein
VLHNIDVVDDDDDDDDDSRGTRECGVVQIIVMIGRAAVFAVPVYCESGSMYISVEHVWVDLS